MQIPNFVVYLHLTKRYLSNNIKPCAINVFREISIDPHKRTRKISKVAHMLQIFMVALIGIELVTKQPAQEFRPQFDRTNVCVCVCLRPLVSTPSRATNPSRVFGCNC